VPLNSITTYPVRCFLTFFNNDREFQTCLMLQTGDVTFDMPNVPNTSSGSAFWGVCPGIPMADDQGHGNDWGIRRTQAALLHWKMIALGGSSHGSYVSSQVFEWNLHHFIPYFSEKRRDKSYLGLVGWATKHREEFAESFNFFCDKWSMMGISEFLGSTMPHMLSATGPRDEMEVSVLSHLVI